MVVLKYRGFCAPVFTAFRDDMSIDTDIIPKYAEFLANNGVDGVLVQGSSGQSMSMTVQERKAHVEEWSKAVKITKQHLMVQVGGCPLPDVIELAKHAESIGVAAILCLPELYFRPTTIRQLINYLKIVGEAAPNTPLLYYHIPAWSGVNLNMAALMNEAASELPTFQGIKYSTVDLEGGVAALKACNGKYEVFLGTNTMMAAACAMGFNSFIATTLNFLPQSASGIMKAVKEGRMEEARKIQEQLTAACSAITKHGHWVPTMKVAMNLVTPINVGKSRPPLDNLTEAQEKEMRDSLKAISVL
ncbi:unnamed protein product [Phaedon cochleariae]|uniref:N-acetylneuraminate lyase n=1 Tax=Phaedon cochleariae TaxID=80249 RepID=A0A9N9SHV1_PHACE|nr:unnamed protein product [Phaedon cochleariae]